MIIPSQIDEAIMHEDFDDEYADKQEMMWRVKELEQEELEVDRDVI